MHRRTVEERRARLATRHHLSPTARAATIAEAADSVVAVHATDPASSYIGLGIRVSGATPSTIETALYDERSVLRTLAMRRTLFVVTPAVLPVVQAACTVAIDAKERQKLLEILDQADMAAPGQSERWLADLEDEVERAVEAAGEAAAAELSKLVPALAQKVVVGAGTRWAAEVGLSSRVLFVMATAGRIVRGRPRGSWISTQHRWAPMTTWIGGPIPSLDQAEAQVDLAGRYLRAFGPATAADLKWWAGWTMTAARRALAGAGAVEVDVAGEAAYVAADDLEATPEPEPWVALLPALDTTPMGWTGRDWFLGEHRALLFDRSGNIGPTIWCHGRVVGGWAQRPDGEIATRLLEDVGAEATGAVEAEAAALEAWLQPVRFTSRFPTPLERSLRE